LLTLTIISDYQTTVVKQIKAKILDFLFIFCSNDGDRIVEKRGGEHDDGRGSADDPRWRPHFLPNRFTLDLLENAFGAQ
jgi:hypothetical protein